MATPYRQDDDIVSGNNYTITINCQDEDGTAVTVTGGSASYAIAKSSYGPSLVSLTSAEGYISLSGTAITLTLPGTATAGLDGRYYHELAVWDSSSNPYTGLAGQLNIIGDLI